MSAGLHGYVGDIPYLRDFKPMLAPAWLDHVALCCGVEPPARRNGFTWCDLGCGQGVTAAILAATHPRGRFYGIDAMAVHIDHARRLASEAGIGNLHLDAVDFATAGRCRLPQFDYLVAHGVYSWIDAASQAVLRRLIDRHLKPGGLVYISYNAMPGWMPDLPFQRLVHELGRVGAGDSAARLAAATEVIGRMAAAGVPALARSATLAGLAAQPQDYPAAYLVHEFMHAAWRPLYVTEMRRAMAEIGLVPVGSATLSENFDALVLRDAARTLLAGIADRDVRELLRDFFLDQRLRCDVFDRGNRRLAGAERETRLLETSYALCRPAAAIHYRMTTAAGARGYDSPVARAIVAALASGPRRLAGLVPAPDLLEALLTLCAAGEVMPVEPGHAPVERLNRAIGQRLDSAEEILWLALPCGTAVAVDRELLRALRRGTKPDGRRFPGWRDFLAAHGVPAQEGLPAQ
ncbi:MAG TPA: class I SAM-dependent methyltransferase [Stellaceae bacterium]|nr:class I SAM-dependent methyltransferase [Stellaceae bacterium]